MIRELLKSKYTLEDARALQKKYIGLLKNNNLKNVEIYHPFFEEFKKTYKDIDIEVELTRLWKRYYDFVIRRINTRRAIA